MRLFDATNGLGLIVQKEDVGLYAKVYNCLSVWRVVQQLEKQTLQFVTAALKATHLVKLYVLLNIIIKSINVDLLNKSNKATIFK